MTTATSTRRAPFTVGDMRAALGPALSVRYVPASLPDKTVIPAGTDVAELAELAAADATAATAAAVHDTACRELRAAQAAMTDANRAYLEAEAAWGRALDESTAAQAALAAARRTAGLVLTADGYRPAV